MTHTHQKRPYRAHAVQWNGSNYHEVEALFAGTGSYPSLYDNHQIIVRSMQRIDTLSPGWWVVKGENGVVKCYDDATFNVKYEPMEGN